MEYLTIIAGVIMILGAYLFFIGKVFETSIVYQIPNAIYLLNAYNHKDLLGFLFVLVGIILAVATIYKMHIGVLKKGIS